MTSIILYSSDKKTQLRLFEQDIINFCCVADIEKPAKQLTITIKRSHLLSYRFNKIKLCHGDFTIFDGFINNMLFQKSVEGENVKIIASSFACVLLSKFAEPQMYNNLSLKNLVDEYFAPLGFSFYHYHTDLNNLIFSSLPSFTILPKTNFWGVLKNFTKHALNLNPLIIEDRYITLSNQFLFSTFSISNVENKTRQNEILKNYNYSSLTLNIKNQPFEDELSTQNSGFNKPQIILSATLPDLIIAKPGLKISVFDECLEEQINEHQFIVQQSFVSFKNSSFLTNLTLAPYSCLKNNLVIWIRKELDYGHGF